MTPLGADMKPLAELRAARVAAVEAMERTLAAIEEPQEGADVEVLERNHEEAVVSYERAAAAVDGAEAVEEARSSLPAPPAEEREPESEERGGSPEVRVGREPL